MSVTENDVSQNCLALRVLIKFWSCSKRERKTEERGGGGEKGREEGERKRREERKGDRGRERKGRQEEGKERKERQEFHQISPNARLQARALEVRTSTSLWEMFVTRDVYETAR